MQPQQVQDLGHSGTGQPVHLCQAGLVNLAGIQKDAKLLGKRQLPDDGGLLQLPGRGFGPPDGDGHVRHDSPT